MYNSKTSERLSGMTALVTGAAQGMGFAIAEMLALNGARIVLCDINLPKTELAAEKIIQQGADATARKLDVCNEQQVNELVQSVIAEYGQISILVNNAGILRPTRIENISKAEWDTVLDVNLNGVFLCSKAVLSDMRKNRFGRIINMSSSAGRSVSTLGGAHYTASKAAVIGLTRAMAKEISKDSITVNAICPGLIDTEMVRNDCTAEQRKRYEQSFPVPRLGTPQEVAHCTLFLVENAYMSGACIDINGGDLML